jgi:hypothetical protein
MAFTMFRRLSVGLIQNTTETSTLLDKRSNVEKRERMKCNKCKQRKKQRIKERKWE